MKLTRSSSHILHPFYRDLRLILILLTVLLSFSSIGQNSILNRKISIEFENVTLKEALKNVEQRSGIRIAFNSNAKCMEDQIANANIVNQPLKNVLEALLNKKGLGFKLVGEIITIYSLEENKRIEEERRTYTISGTVSDANTGEALIGVNIYDLESLQGATSNAYGFYSFGLPAGKHTIVISYSGYVTHTNEMILEDNTSLKVNLEESSIELSTVEVIAEESKLETTEISSVRFTPQRVAAIPAILGEPDMQQAILSSAGVSSVGEGTTGFNVRGGKTDHNLILVDEAPLYNTAHLFGFISVINNDAVKDMKFYKAGIPARYGGRTSSVVDIRLREGNSRSFEGALSLNPLSSKIGLEIPIIKDRLNVYFSGRRSFLDLFMNLPDDSEEEGQELNFHDATIKLNFVINERNRIFLSGYSGADHFNQQYLDNGNVNKDGFGWGDRLATLRWNHIFSDKVFSNFTLITGNYQFEYATSFDDVAGQPTRGESGVKTTEGKIDVSFFMNSKFDFHLGTGVKNNIFTPLNQKSASSDHLPSPKEFGLEYFSYIDLEFNPLTPLKIRAGLRYAGLWNYGPGFIYKYDPNLPKSEITVENVERVAANKTIAHYHYPEPRVALSYQLDRKNAVKVAYDRMIQYVHLLSSSNAIVPFDSWAPSGYHLKPTISDQVTVGYVQSRERWQFSVDVFAKQMSNFVEFRENQLLLFLDQKEVSMLPAELNAHGVELTVENKSSKWEWSANYTWSRSFVKTLSPFESIQINNGRAFPSNYDRPHNLNVLVSFTPSARVRLNSKFMFQSGRPITLPEGRINNLIIYSDRNSFRLKPNHRLDVSITILPKMDSSKKIKGEWVFSILNLYGYKNTFSYLISKTGTGVDTPYALKKVSILGSIIPTFSYNMKF
ncbi:TonB-dependent receptor [Ekhidna sp.]|uniref:TonB-dependent receptor n=1 Tax=Ekhidna sp. TaxID=2608089 RepID=UPI0032977364